jgi:hypothetical protein
MSAIDMSAIDMSAIDMSAPYVFLMSAPQADISPEMNTAKAQCMERSVMDTSLKKGSRIARG